MVTVWCIFSTFPRTDLTVVIPGLFFCSCGHLCFIVWICRDLCRWFATAVTTEVYFVFMIDFPDWPSVWWRCYTNNILLLHRGREKQPFIWKRASVSSGVLKTITNHYCSQQSITNDHWSQWPIPNHFCSQWPTVKAPVCSLEDQGSRYWQAATVGPLSKALKSPCFIGVMADLKKSISMWVTFMWKRLAYLITTISNNQITYLHFSQKAITYHHCFKGTITNH